MKQSACFTKKLTFNNFAFHNGNIWQVLPIKKQFGWNKIMIDKNNYISIFYLKNEHLIKGLDKERYSTKTRLFY